MQSTLDAAEEAGYIVARINAKATGNEILWDSVADAFCYLNDGNIEYMPDVTEKKRMQITSVGSLLPIK